MRRILVLALLMVTAPASAQTLDAPEDVRETAHRVRVRIDRGVAEIEHRIELTRGDRRRAEVGYRLALPAGGELIGVDVCVGARCRRARAIGGTVLDPYPIALHGRARGRTLRPIARVVGGPDHVEVRAAPVGRGARLSLVVRVAAPLAIGGGLARASIPARDADPRLAPAEVEVVGARADAISIDRGGARETVPVDRPIAIEARIAAPWIALSRTDCDPAPCVAARVVEPRRAVMHDVVLAIDVSPSMEDVPAGRMRAAIAGLVAALPPGSGVRALRFGARARFVHDGFVDPGSLDVDALASGAPGELGSRTRFSAIAPLADEAMTSAIDPVLIVMGDGWLDRADFAPLAAAGVRVVIANVGDEPFGAGALRAARAVPSTMAVALGPALGGQAAGPGPGALIAEPSAPRSIVLSDGSTIALTTLPSGEALEWTGDDAGARLVSGGRARRAAEASETEAALMAPGAIRDLLAIDRRVLGDLSKWLLPSRGLPPVPGGIGGVDDALTPPPYRWLDGRGAALAPRRSVRVPMLRVAPVRIRSTLSARTLGRLLARQLHPVAEGCFTAARRGRPAWQARADVSLVLGHREVIDAQVQGENVDAALASCILAATDDLQIPFFERVIRVNRAFRAWPLERPAALPLDAETGAALDALALDPAPDPATLLP